MTLLFDKSGSIASPELAPLGFEDGDARAGGDAPVIEIGLVNNMSDAALRATERQFARLLDAGSGGRRVRLHCLALPSIVRSPAARHRIDSLYTDIADLDRLKLDGLIVTGAEPRTADLRDEPYWRDMTALIDWAESNTRSTIWSCLAAHAVVLHRSGIARRRLPYKCSGVYEGLRLSDDPLLNGLSDRVTVPHSRYNDLACEDLTRSGYQVLTSSGAGVDIFVREGNSRFVFLQGHPEYDATTLQREYLRDVGRYLTGEQAEFPDVPLDYFCAATERNLMTFRAAAQARRAPEMIAKLPRLSLRAGLAAAIESSAAALFGNWVAALARD
ncbi:homoserine O-succinyltransferase [Rhodopseudomonas sp. B29]|uniref:homoserine O-succinyltransferase MetA n=1 Tax=Rhodopseudomonas sp. B29 TaxID=95607 RepID=UPI00034909E2|nr:homoserine O-succinyltransferase [Rhodopseudomonas sp. B29]